MACKARSLNARELHDRGVLVTDATQAGGYRLYEREGNCGTCGFAFTLSLTGQAYMEAEDKDNIYWYAVAGQVCPNCNQPAAGVSQPLSEIAAQGLVWWYVDAAGNHVDAPVEEVDSAPIV